MVDHVSLAKDKPSVFKKRKKRKRQHKERESAKQSQVDDKTNNNSTDDTEFKLENIKETEDAKRRMLRPKHKHKELIAHIPRSYNADFATRHFERVRAAQQKEQKQRKRHETDRDRESKRRRIDR